MELELKLHQIDIRFSLLVLVLSFSLSSWAQPGGKTAYVLHQESRMNTVPYSEQLVQELEDKIIELKKRLEKGAERHEAMRLKTSFYVFALQSDLLNNDIANGEIQPGRYENYLTYFHQLYDLEAKDEEGKYYQDMAFNEVIWRFNSGFNAALQNSQMEDFMAIPDHAEWYDVQIKCSEWWKRRPRQQ